MMKCILEYGQGWYAWFDSIKEAKAYRESINSNGILWTESGHMIGEEECDEDGNLHEQTKGRALQMKAGKSQEGKE